MQRPWLCIDGNSLLYRAFFAVPPLNGPDGTPTNAVYGFVHALHAVVQEVAHPARVYVAWDAHVATFRHEQYADYKAGRAPTPPELSVQRPLVVDVLDAMGVVQHTVPGFEADDIIGTIAAVASQMGQRVFILTGDRDLLQLVNEHVTVCMPRKGGGLTHFTPTEVHATYGVFPERFVDLKALMGDKSDNIPGCPGIGQITGAKLLQQYASIEQLLSRADEIAGKVGTMVRTHRDAIVLSKSLATICTSVPLTLSDVPEPTFDSEWVQHQYRKLGFRSFVDPVPASPKKVHASPRATHIEDVLDTKERTKEPPKEPIHERTKQPKQDHSPLIDDEPIHVRWITTETVESWAHDARQWQTMHVETLGDNPHYAQCIALVVVEQHTVSIVPRDVLHSPQANQVRVWLADAQTPKTFVDALTAGIVLHWQGVALRGVVFDVLLAAYLAAPTSGAQTVHDWVAHFGGAALPADEKVYGPRVVSDEAFRAQHMAKKVMAMHRLRDVAQRGLDAHGVRALFETLEMPLVDVLVRMACRGMLIDEHALDQYGRSLDAKMTDVRAHIIALAGVSFNLNSPKQLAEVLFDRLQLSAGKKSDSKRSTNIDVLEKLRKSHPIVEHMITYRQLSKLHSAYIEGLRKEIHPQTKNIHTVFRQTVAATGRLSSQHPNLQTIPIRTEEGRHIRRMFVPSQPGWVLLSADYSQIELRVLAHLSQDETMIAAFHRNADIHTQTAMRVFGVPEHAVDDAMRRKAKAVNFGIVYGMSDYGLSQNVHISIAEATKFIEAYFDVYKGVKEYMEHIVEKARRDGFVTTLMHRTRAIPNVHASNFNVRSFAERTAMNTPIQGSAADIIKCAMLRVDDKLAQMQARMLLQVHDELVFEAPEAEATTLVHVVREAMEQAVKLTVPLHVSIAVGPNWDEMHDV
jgi:DNA polymerase-1